MRERPLSAIKDLISRAREAPLAVIALTDEEIAALDGDLTRRGPVPLPWLDDRDRASRELACRVALRGLAARRLVVLAGPAGPGGSGPGGGDFVVASDDLRAVLAMRRSAHAVVCALRESDGQLRLVYLGRSGALEEAISPEGLHDFTVLARDAVAERLAAFTDPAAAAPAAPGQDWGQQWGRGPGPGADSEVLSLAEIAGGAEITAAAGARSVTMVARLVFGSATGEQRLTVYAKEASVIVASPADVGGAPALRFAEVSRSGLRVCLADLVGLALRLVAVPRRRNVRTRETARTPARAAPARGACRLVTAE